ncbi:hypothetical protein H2248_004080 [Termitomyces sp. 'cryptogamus']|nr:hypothetical protein H2248_004080 [Termitomyces sp. 'cryptogamus']
MELRTFPKCGKFSSIRSLKILSHDLKISDHQESKNSERCMKARTGNFSEGADEFDNNPREAKSMDLKRPILLHTAYQALKDSGYVPNSTPTDRPESFGCYIGVPPHTYLTKFA